MANLIYRNVRHELPPDREKWLKDHFGLDVEFHTEDVPYKDNPVAAVMAVVARLEADGDRVIAIEAGGPESKLLPLSEGLAEKGIPLIRQVYVRDEASGRAKVIGKDDTGRDLFAFDRYEAVGVEVRKALVGRPL